MRFEGKQYRLNFYDPERLAYDVKNTLENHNWFIDDNVIVVKSVDRIQMQDAAEYLVKSGRINFFRPET